MAAKTAKSQAGQIDSKMSPEEIKKESITGFAAVHGYEWPEVTSEFDFFLTEKESSNLDELVKYHGTDLKMPKGTRRKLIRKAKRISKKIDKRYQASPFAKRERESNEINYGYAKESYCIGGKQ